MSAYRYVLWSEGDNIPGMLAQNDKDWTVS